MVALVSGAAGTVAATALTVQGAEAVEMLESMPAGTVEVADTVVAADIVGVAETVVTADTVGVADTVEAADTVEVADTVGAADSVGVADTAEVADTVEVAEVESVGTVEVVEALGHQLLCAMTGRVESPLVSAECSVVPAQFSGAVLL